MANGNQPSWVLHQVVDGNRLAWVSHQVVTQCSDCSHLSARALPAWAFLGSELSRRGRPPTNGGATGARRHDPFLDTGLFYNNKKEKDTAVSK
jgi:hypothetical protein